MNPTGTTTIRSPTCCENHLSSENLDSRLSLQLHDSFTMIIIFFFFPTEYTLFYKNFLLAVQFFFNIHAWEKRYVNQLLAFCYAHRENKFPFFIFACNKQEPREKGKYSYGKWIIKITFEVEFLFQNTIRKTKKTKY